MTAAATHHNIPSSAVAGSLGDGMSVNVLASVLMKGLHHSGLKEFDARQEHWRLAENQAAAELSDRLSLIRKLSCATVKRRHR